MSQKNSKNARIDKYFIAIIAITILLRIVWYLLTGYTADDAFITFRFAENIAAGNGFVYNIGERVLGTTTPLFTLIIAFFSLLSIPPLVAAFTINTISSGITVYLIFRLAQKLEFGRLAFLPAIMLLFFPRLLVTDTGGMETAFFTMLATASLYYNAHARLPQMLTFASLAALTRPEGFILLFIVCLYRLFTRTITMLKLSVIPIALIGPWVVFAWKYFGTPIPHSIPAKFALYSNFGTMSVFDNVGLVLNLNQPLGVLLAIFCFIGIIYLFAANRYGICEMVWVIAIIDFLAISKTHIFLWYVSPLYPYYFLFAVAGLMYLLKTTYYFKNRLRTVSNYVYAAALIMLVFLAVKTNQHYSTQQQTLNQVHKAIGLYLSENVADIDIVAAEDVGYIGYYSGKKILDRDGLVSPETVPYNRDRKYFDLIKDKRPDWVVADPDSPISKFVFKPAFSKLYDLKKEFTSDAGITYRVYKRIHQYSSASPVYE